MGLLSLQPLTPVAGDSTRLFGATLLRITWSASRLAGWASRRLMPHAGALLVYTSLGLIIFAARQLAGRWEPAGWSMIVTYLIVAAAYASLLIKPEEAETFQTTQT